MFLEKVILRLNLIVRNSSCWLCTYYMYFLCYAKNIQIDKICIFWGLSIFEKSLYTDKIIIGNNYRFKSITRTNLIGINRPCIISTQSSEQSSVIIGNNSSFSGTVIGCFNSIILGNNVMCGANTLITDSGWHSEDFRTGESKPVVIKDGVWLGVNVMVLKGVTIGENTVIGAGSIVVKDIPANSIAAGNPCKVLKYL